jgi:GT2 family glycosyltransferase
MSVRASVLICVHGKLDYTRRCLETLLGERSPLLHEIVVVDNASTDGTAAWLGELAAREPLVHVLSPGENLGFVGGNNLAAEHATGDYLVLLNNDTEPRPGWLEALVETAERDASVGAVGAKLIYPDGRLQEAGAIVFSDGSGWNYGRSGDPADPRFSFVREVDYCSAACLLVRAELWHELGGFDERYAPAYYEDTDLCFAIRDSGRRVLLQPRAEIVHHEGATAGTDLASGFKRHQEINRHAFREKWATELRAQAQPHASLVRLASNRATGRRILIVDPFMPRYDRASGSRRLWELVRLLRSGGHAVTFVALNGADGDRYRAELEQLGVEVYQGDPAKFADPRAWPFDLAQLLADTGYDLALLSFYYIAELYLPEIRALSPRTRIVVDSVDLHFLREKRAAELGLPDGDNHEKTRRRELAVYSKADSIVVVTETDRHALLADLPDATVHVIPNIHDVPEEVASVAGRSGLLFVGNFAHPPNIDAARLLCEEVLPQILAEQPDVELTIVGQNPPPEIETLSGPNVHVTGWVADLQPLLAEHRVSVAPLRYGAGMKGKIGEALAHGLPVVTTPSGAEGMDGNGAMLVAEGPQELAAAAVSLLRDDVLWTELADKGRALVEERWSPRAVQRSVDELTEAETAVDSDLTSIVILVRDQPDLTQACLESIETHTPEWHEVIVVDNGSAVEAADLLDRWSDGHANVTVVHNLENRGFAAGNNQGFALARGGTVCLLNNDTEVTPGWLGAMRAVLDREPAVGLVGPVTNRARGPQLVDESYETTEERLIYAATRAESFAGMTLPCDRLIGFCLLARREVIDRIGGLDERFGFGNFEDDDFSVRALAEGWEGRIALDSFIHHVGGQTFAGSGIDYSQQFLHNFGLYKQKWSLAAGLGLRDDLSISDEALAGTCRYEPLPCVGASHTRTGDGRVWQETSETPVHAAPVAAIRTGNVEHLHTSFEEASRWDDPQRRYWIRKHLAENVLSTPRLAPATWIPFFAAAAECLLDALDEEPCEPELLNYAGVFLYELGAYAGAEQLFRAGLRLDAELMHGTANLAAARERRRRGDQLPAQFRIGTRELTARAQRIAPRARPAEGLTLSLCMIVKDEEEMLAGCLEPVYRQVDEIVVVDTGSSDRTVEIAESFGAKVIHFPWNGSFADARNVSLEAATGDWILYLDADEHVLPETAPLLRDLLGRTWREGFHLVETNYTGGDVSGPAVTHLALRIFRNRPDYRFEGRIHEQKTRNMPTYLPERFETASVRMLHYGYLKGRVADKDKSRRNLELLEQEAAEGACPFTEYNLGSEYVRLGDHERAREHFERAWSLLGESWHDVGYAAILLTRLSAARRQTGDLVGAKTVLLQGVAAFPDHTDLILELAACVANEGNLDEAEQLCLRCLEMGDAPARYVATVGSGTFLALSLLASLKTESGDAAGAEEILRRSLSDYPDYVAPVLPLVASMLGRGCTPEEAATVVPQERPSAMLLAGMACHEAGHAEAAESWFRQALEHQPANGVARVGLVESLLSQRRYADAADEASREPADSAVARATSLARLFGAAALGDLHRLGVALATAGTAGVPEHDLAVYRGWQAALAGTELPPHLPAAAAETLLVVLEALLRVHDFEAFETAHALWQRVELPEVERREALGRMYFRRGFVESAAGEWLEAARAEPTPAVLFGLAQVAYTQGLNADAISFLDSALELDPSSTDAAKMKEAIEQRLAA